VADKRKDLNSIRPAKGVKLKQKRPSIPTEKNIQKPKVIENVDPNPPSYNELPPASEEAMKIMVQSKEAKANLISAIKEFNGLLNNRKLKRNKSAAESKVEQETINNLISTALKVEDYSMNEGIVGLCVVAIRQALSLRDAGNEMAYQVGLLEARIKKLESKNEEKE